jgi:hypothetical protein
MSDILEYRLTGGILRLGKREALLELLRKDSALRQLLGLDQGQLKTLTAEMVRASSDGDSITLDFSQLAELSYFGDPAVPLGELKKRYGERLSGLLHFKCVYTMGFQNFYLKADLDKDPVILNP